MKAHEFVSAINKKTPTMDVLKKIGLSKTESISLIDSFKCVPRKESISYNDEILNLLSSFDCSNLEIGMITFLKKIVEKENFYLLGKLEVDDLIFVKETNQIVVVENKTNHLMWKCADNGEKFLDALFRCSLFLIDRIIDDRLWEDLSVAKELAKDCSRIAGNIDYYDFYAMILGAEE